MNALVEKLKGRLVPAPRASRVGPIGLHFAEEQVHAVQLRRLASAAYCLRAWASARYPDTREDALESPARLQRVLSKLLSRGRFQGREVVTALPPAMSRITSLNYQVSGKTADGEAILRLMESRLDGPIGDYVIDFLPVRGDASSRDRVALVGPDPDAGRVVCRVSDDESGHATSFSRRSPVAERRARLARRGSRRSGGRGASASQPRPDRETVFGSGGH